MARTNHLLIAGMMALQGLLLVVGDVGCYLAWYCVNWLDWHGYLGLAFLGAAIVIILVEFILDRKIKC